MRKFSLMTLITVSLAVAGCWPFGGGNPQQTDSGQPAQVAIPSNVQGEQIRPDTAFRDNSIGPARPGIADVYRIRTGDQLEIGVWGEDDMTKKITVGPDGRISYFLATEMLASGRTLSELKSGLRKELGKHFKHPEVFVSLLDSAGNFVSVTGTIKSPGLYNINNETRLLDVIAKAGGIPLGSSSYGTSFTEIADLNQAFVLRGEKFLDVDFEKLHGRNGATGREIAANNVLLQPNDRIYIPALIRMDNKIFVVGAVRNPSMIQFSGKISLLEAVMRTGDVPEQAWERKAFIVRGRMNNPKIMPVNLRQVRKGEIPDIPLVAGDVIFVPKTPLAKTVEVIRQLDTIFGGVTRAEAAYQVRFDRHP